MIEKAYLEITNICNLSCPFCHGTKRERRMLSYEEFDLLTTKLRGSIKYLYFHLMGEPLLHPDICRFIILAKEKGFSPMLTTNGTLLPERGKELLSALPKKISISLHSADFFEGKGEYLSSCIKFSKRAAELGCITVLRLWNLNSESEAENAAVIKALEESFPPPWRRLKHKESFCLTDGLYLEWGEEFSWPDTNAPRAEGGVFCRGLRDQIGVLCDGTVVPCCLDADGSIALGNLFDSSLESILASPRARALYDGFSRREPSEALCRTCGYAKRFDKRRP